jgi:hypothetical protein
MRNVLELLALALDLRRALVLTGLSATAPRSPQPPAPRLAPPFHPFLASKGTNSEPLESPLRLLTLFLGWGTLGLACAGSGSEQRMAVGLVGVRKRTRGTSRTPRLAGPAAPPVQLGPDRPAEPRPARPPPAQGFPRSHGPSELSINGSWLKDRYGTRGAWSRQCGQGGVTWRAAGPCCGRANQTNPRKLLVPSL